MQPRFPADRSVPISGAELNALLYRTPGTSAEKAARHRSAVDALTDRFNRLEPRIYRKEDIL